MPSYRAGTEALKWIAEVWAPEIDVLAYEESVILQQVTDLTKLGQKLHIPKHDNLARATIADTVIANNLSFVANTETEATVSPTTTVVPVEVDMRTIVRMANDPSDMLRRSIEMSLAEGIDVQIASLAAAFATSIVGDIAANVDKSVVLDAVRALAVNAKMYFRPGVSDGIAIFHGNQVDDLLSISDITNAQFRGDDQKPVATGWVARAFGLRFYETGSIQPGGGGLVNMAFIQRGLGISFNQRPTVESQAFQLVQRLIGWTDCGAVTIRDQYCVKVNTTAAA